MLSWNLEKVATRPVGGTGSFWGGGSDSGGGGGEGVEARRRREAVRGGKDGEWRRIGEGEERWHEIGKERTKG